MLYSIRTVYVIFVAFSLSLSVADAPVCAASQNRFLTSHHRGTMLLVWHSFSHFISRSSSSSPHFFSSTHFSYTRFGFVFFFLCHKYKKAERFVFYSFIFLYINWTSNAECANALRTHTKTQRYAYCVAVVVVLLLFLFALCSLLKRLCLVPWMVAVRVDEV